MISMHDLLTNGFRLVLQSYSGCPALAGRYQVLPPYAGTILLRLFIGYTFLPYIPPTVPKILPLRAAGTHQVVAGLLEAASIYLAARREGLMADEPMK